MSASMLRCVPGVGMYFSSLQYLKVMVGVEPGTPPAPLTAFLMGVGARTISGTTMIPVTVIKTRYESGLYSFVSLRHAFTSTYLKEGRAGLTCGLGPTLLRDAPFSGLYLMFYTHLKQQFPAEMRDGS